MDDQVLRIKLVAESNLASVMDKDAAAVARAQGLLAKLAEEEHRNNAALIKIWEERQRSIGTASARLAELQNKRDAELQQHAQTEAKINQQIVDSERQAQEAITRVHEQQYAEQQRHDHRMLDLQMQLKRQQTQGNVYGATRTKLDISQEEDRNLQRQEQLARREQIIQETNLSRSQTINRAIEAETRRHVEALAGLAEQRAKVFDLNAVKQKEADEQVEAEARRHNAALNNLEQQGLNEQNRIASEQERTHQKAMRSAMQNSFAMFGIALGAQSALRAFEEATGEKAPAALKVMASSLSTVSDLMLTGSVINAKYGATIGGIVGIGIAAVQMLNLLDEDAQKLNDTFSQMARKEDTLDYLAKLHGLTEDAAQALMDASKASGEFAQKMDKINKMSEETLRDKFMKWLGETQNLGGIFSTELSFEGGPHFQMRAVQQREEEAKKLTAEALAQAAAINRLETIWQTTHDAAKKYYDAVEKGAQAATRENERFAQVLQDIQDRLLQAQAKRDEVLGGTAFGRERGLEGSEGTGTAYKKYSEARARAEQQLNDRLAELQQQREANARQEGFDRETIGRELTQRLTEIEYDYSQAVMGIEHQLAEQRAQIAHELAERLASIEHDRQTKTASTLREYYDGEADAAFRYQQQIEDLNFNAARNEQEYQFDLQRLEEQAQADRLRREQEYQNARARLSRDYAYERMRIERELAQSLMALGFNTSEQMRGAKTEHELENIQRRYQFEAVQLRQNARDQMQDLAHRIDEEKRALDERRKLERQEQALRLKMAREELEHRIQMQREELAHRRAQLDAQYAYEREKAARDLAQKLADIEAQAAYDKQQAEQKAAYDRQQAEQKAAYDRQQANEKAAHDRALAQQQAEDQIRQLNFRVEQQKTAMEKEAEQAKKRYEDEKEAAKKAYEEETAEAQKKFDAEAKYYQEIVGAEVFRHAQVMANIKAEAELYKAELENLMNIFQNPGAYPNPNLREDRLPPPDVPGHAMGTDMLVTKPYLFVAGERGAEHVRVTPVSGTQSSGGGEQVFNITINGTDAEEIWRGLQPILRRELRRT